MQEVSGSMSASIAGKRADFAAKRGSVFLIVNTASACGFTPQFKGLERLWEDYRVQGLVVAGFPCNQFGHQEPGDAAQIGQFCTSRFGVSFPMSAKIEVNGPGTHPLFDLLKAAQPGLLGSEAIKWNFTKFLVDRDGAVLQRYAPKDTPEMIWRDIEQLLVNGR